MDPAPFLRGNPFPSTRSVAYPRAKPGDGRIPGDTWYTASFPIGVRLELDGDARAIRVDYSCRGADVTWVSEMRRTFEVWRGDECIASERVEEGDGSVERAHGATRLGSAP